MLLQVLGLGNLEQSRPRGWGLAMLALDRAVRVVLHDLHVLRHIDGGVKHAVGVVTPKDVLRCSQLPDAHKAVVTSQEVLRKLLQVFSGPVVELMVDQIENCDFVGVKHHHKLVHIAGHTQGHATGERRQVPIEGVIG